MDKIIEEKYIQLRKVKTEIIQDLLGKGVENLYEKYSDEFSDYMKLSDIDFDDGIMFIQLEAKYSKEDFNKIDMFKIYLKDFENKCEEFIEKMKKEVCVNHIKLKYDYYEYDKNVCDDVFYDCCEIGFEIVDGSKKYELNYTNGNY